MKNFELTSDEITLLLDAIAFVEENAEENGETEYAEALDAVWTKIKEAK